MSTLEQAGTAEGGPLAGSPDVFRFRREKSWAFRLTTRSLGASVPMRLLLAGGLVAVALAARLLLDPLVQEHHPFTLFILATLVASWFGGWLPALSSILLGFLCADWFFVEPRHSFSLGADPELIGAGAFYASFSLISAFGGVMMRAALAQAVGTQTQLQREIEERRKAQLSLTDQHRRLEVLNLAAANLLSNLEPEAALQTVYSRISEYFAVDGFIEYQLNAEGTELELISCTFLDSDVPKQKLARLKVGQSISGRAAALRQAQVLANVQQSEDPEVKLIKSLGVRAYACEPLVAGTRLLGTLAFASSRRRAFEPEDQEFFAALANYIALTRDRLRLRAELQERAQDLEHAVQERTARLRETVHELEYMSYNIMHDMRAPLRSIQSFADLMEEEMGPALKGPPGDYLARMKSSAQRMDALIRDVLSYGSTVGNELPLQPVEVSRLISEIIETYPAFRAHREHIQLQPDMPSVIGNQAALTQCFSNLLGNALKFTNPGCAPRLRIAAVRVDNWVRITVEDNGIGIASEYHEKIFGMFTRLSKEHEGTGIGLAIVKKAAERMGGRVGVVSEPGKGSCFWVELRPA